MSQSSRSARSENYPRDRDPPFSVSLASLFCNLTLSFAARFARAPLRPFFNRPPPPCFLFLRESGVSPVEDRREDRRPISQRAAREEFPPTDPVPSSKLGKRRGKRATNAGSGYYPERSEEAAAENGCAHNRFSPQPF